MRKISRPEPRYKIGDIIGTIARANQWGNEWYEDSSKIVKVEYTNIIPGVWHPLSYNVILYTLEDGRRIYEKDIPALTGYIFGSSDQRW